MWTMVLAHLGSDFARLSSLLFPQAGLEHAGDDH
jgi:hypothetical protein